MPKMLVKRSEMYVRYFVVDAEDEEEAADMAWNEDGYEYVPKKEEGNGDTNVLHPGDEVTIFWDNAAQEVVVIEFNNQYATVAFDDGKTIRVELDQLLHWS